MQIIPICSISGLQANKVCINPACQSSGFICRSCASEECEQLHTHQGRLTAVRWDETALHIRQLLTKKNSILGALKDLRQVGIGFQRVVQGFLQAINALAQMFEKNGILSETLQKLQKKQFEKVTGRHFSVIFEGLASPLLKSPQKFISQFDEDICKLTHELRAIADRLSPSSDGFKVRHTHSGVKLEQPKQKQATGLEEIFQLAENYQKEGKPERAIELYGEAIKMQPDSAEAFSNRARVFSETGMNRQAIIDYTQEIAYRPKGKSVEALIKRSQIYKKLKVYPKAEEDLNKAITIEPNDYEIYLKRAKLYNDQLKFELAESDFNKCIELNPNCVEAYYGRGTLFYETGYSKPALADLTKAISLNHSYHEAFNLRGKYFLDEKEYDLALKDFDTAIQLRREPSYLRNRVDLKMSMGKMAEAQEDLIALKKLNSSK